MIISVVNHTGGTISDSEIQKTIRAINRQIEEDFAPHWGMSATLRLEGRSAEAPDAMELADLRGDAVIYLWNGSDGDDAIGYHARHGGRGIPFGFVFTEIARGLREPWSVTLSHEALELIVDPEANLLVMGPHPTEEERDVFYWYEVCDAVQKEKYEIDGVAVSNFLLPLYFTGTRETDEKGARNDFLGQNGSSPALTSFGVRQGGYAGFFDPELRETRIFRRADDPEAESRFRVKERAKEARRAIRYRDPAARAKIRAATGREQEPREPRLEPDQIRFIDAGSGPDRGRGSAPRDSRRRVAIPSGNGHFDNGDHSGFAKISIPAGWIERPDL